MMNLFIITLQIHNLNILHANIHKSVHKYKLKYSKSGAFPT
jgi:hypothetical protein